MDLESESLDDGKNPGRARPGAPRARIPQDRSASLCAPRFRSSRVWPASRKGGMHWGPSIPRYSVYHELRSLDTRAVTRPRPWRPRARPCAARDRPERSSCHAGRRSAPTTRRATSGRGCRAQPRSRSPPEPWRLARRRVPFFRESLFRVIASISSSICGNDIVTVFDLGQESYLLRQGFHRDGVTALLETVPPGSDVRPR